MARQTGPTPQKRKRTYLGVKRDQTKRRKIAMRALKQEREKGAR